MVIETIYPLFNNLIGSGLASVCYLWLHTIHKIIHPPLPWHRAINITTNQAEKSIRCTRFVEIINVNQVHNYNPYIGFVTKRSKSNQNTE